MRSDWKKKSSSLPKMALFVWMSFFIHAAGVSVENKLELNETDWVEQTQGVDYGKRENGDKKNRDSADTSVPETTPLTMSPLTQRIVFISIVVVLAGFLLFIVLKSVGERNIRIRDTQLVDEVLSEENIEHMHEDELDAYLRNALQSGDLRLAVRIHFLKILKLLAETNKITLRKEKTNSDYVREYARTENPDEFRHITYFYELVWYGESHLSHAGYQKWSRQFESFASKSNQA